MKRGFTLIELLVVIAIIALLSSVIISSLNSARAKANDSRRVSDLRQVQKALELYALDNAGAYPSTGGSWRSQCNVGGNYAAQFVAPGLVPTYISQFPADPQMNIGASTCCYRYVSDGKDYDMLDYSCSTSNTANPALASFQDPNFPTMWSVYTPGAAVNGW